MAYFWYAHLITNWVVGAEPARVSPMVATGRPAFGLPVTRALASPACWLRPLALKPYGQRLITEVVPPPRSTTDGLEIAVDCEDRQPTKSVRPQVGRPIEGEDRGQGTNESRLKRSSCAAADCRGAPRDAAA